MFPGLPPLLQEVLIQQERRASEHREVLRAEVASSKPPLKPELAEKLLCLNDRYVREILRSHAGFPLAQRWASYRASLAIMDCAFDDLIAAITEFETAVLDDTDILGRVGEDKLRSIERKVQKELFATANAAASLVDHTRRFHKLRPLIGYTEQLRACFVGDGLHEFVIALRVLLHHLHCIRAHWRITKDYRENKETATFCLARSNLLQAMHDNGDVSRVVHTFVEASPESIDVREIFLIYKNRVVNFHAWLENEFGKNLPPELCDYEFLLQQKKICDRRIFYKAMLSNWLSWPKSPNPHDHLYRYLTAEELEEVHQLPLNSPTQVDLAIKYGDREGIVDDDIRKQLYHLFERSTERDLPASAQKNADTRSNNDS